MRNKILILLLSIVAASCYYPEKPKEYSIGYNFRLEVDSMRLQEERPMHLLIDPEANDTLKVYKNDILVVAQMDTIPEDSIDSIWVKVAKDQIVQGWVHESELLGSVSPDDPISQAIYSFSNAHTLAFGMFALVVLVLWLIVRLRKRRFHLVHLDDISSPYPMLLCLTLSSSAVLYASIQKFVPETWVYFYFHPTLNPFGLPLILSTFLASIWLMVILLGAALDDIRKSLHPGEALLYTLALFAYMGILYIAFSVSTLYYVGYIMLPIYIVGAIWQYRRRNQARYVCGNCGTKMHELGKCPKCGTLNE